MTDYKLTYFDARGLCDPIRWIFEVSGVEYEDFRFPTSTMPPSIPPEIKKNCTWGQVPILEFDGKKLAQSHAIGRFLAKKYGLAGKDDFEAAEADEYCDTIREMLVSYIPVLFEQDPTKKAEKEKEVMEKMHGRYLSKFEEILQSNGTGWLVGNGMTWADMNMAHFLNHIEVLTEGRVKFAENYTGIQKNYDAVFAHPKIKAWIARRPVTKL